MFVDYVEILVKAGDGGRGCVSFRREKYVPKGGPDGGDGGRGGHIIGVVNTHLSTLMDLHYKRKYRAADGEPGEGKQKHGKDGKDLVLPLPPGTVINDLMEGKKVADLIQPGQRVILAQGGRGGHGNWHFKSPTNQAPRLAGQGGKGEEKKLAVQLQLIADVGLVGFPNVGKSMLLSKVSRARPKIADYPFTTLHPYLGIVRLGEWQSFVMADIPGIIEGAHKGKGLGLQFLRHIKRTRVLLFLIDATSNQPSHDLVILKRELKEYDPELAKKPAVVAVNKIDLLNGEFHRRIVSTRGLAVYLISALTGSGIKALLFGLQKALKESRSI